MPHIHPLAGQIPAELKLGARHLRQLAGAIQENVHPEGVLYTPDSLAAKDLEIRSLDGAWGKPTREVVHEAGVHVNVTFDHLLAMSAVITAPETVLALSTLTRTVLESLAIASWLYEPGIDTRERVRRRYNVRLATLTEQINLAEGVRGLRDAADPRTAAEKDHLGKQVLRIRSSAAAHDYEYRIGRKRPGLTPSRWLHPQMPRVQRLIAAMLEAADVDPRLGPTLHRLTSATAHGQSHGLNPFMMEAADSGRPGTVSIQMGLGLPHFCTLLVGVVLGMKTTAQRLCAYYGWAEGPFDEVLESAYVDLLSWLGLERA